MKKKLYFGMLLFSEKALTLESKISSEIPGIKTGTLIWPVH
jgi:hypothetical protein